MENSTDNVDTKAAVVLSTVSSFLSVCGALGIFGTFILFPDIRNITRKLIVCLTLADFLTVSGLFISTGRYFYELSQRQGNRNANVSTTICNVQSVVTTYSTLVSFNLTIAIEAYLCVTVLYKLTISKPWTICVTNLVCWLLPGVIIIVAYKQQVLGGDTITKTINGAQPVGTGPWCWVRDEATNKKWMWLTGKAWEILCYILTISSFALLKFNLYLKYRYQGLSSIHHNLRDEDQNFLYEWLVIYLLRVWGTIRFIYFVINNKNPNGWILYLQAAGDPGQAFCNFILFCVLDKTVRSKLLGKIFQNGVNKELEELNNAIKNARK